MKNWKLTLLAAAAALGLQACDVTVHDRPGTETAAAPEPAPASTAPIASTESPAPSTMTAAAPSVAPTDSSTASTTAESAPGVAPTDSSTPSATIATAPGVASTDSSMPSTEASATMGAQTPPLPPDTGEMGAAGTAGTLPPDAPAATASSDLVAAPTELARYLEENPVKPRDPQAASSPSDDDDRSGDRGKS